METLSRQSWLFINKLCVRYGDLGQAVMAVYQQVDELRCSGVSGGGG